MAAQRKDQADPADSRWLSPDEQEAWRGLLQMHATLAAVLNRQLTAESDLSLQDYGVLVLLDEATDGQLRPNEIGRRLAAEKSRLSHHLARLAERGLVTRRRCQEDGRGWWIRITVKGRRVLSAAAPRHVAAVRRVFVERLTPEQLAALVEISRAVLENPAVEAECDATEGS
ncbi:MAG TPA: MarR family transcriptional regulator [Acidimicrobiales bacterium]|nr:MarR family transcriptional regulator [Acidimicrobiales bacterium]